MSISNGINGVDAPEVRKPWQRLVVQSHPEGESMTHEAHKEATDVNNIVRRYQRTGVMPPAVRPPQYGDVTGLQGDLTQRLEESRSTISKAESDIAAFQQRQNEKPPVTPPAVPPIPPAEVVGT